MSMKKLNRIIAFYFGRNLSQIEAEYPLALFARLLDGIIAVSKLTKLKIAPTRETQSLVPLGRSNSCPS